jgi:hypothetical protein
LENELVGDKYFETEVVYHYEPHDKTISGPGITGEATWSFPGAMAPG